MTFNFLGSELQCKGTSLVMPIFSTTQLHALNDAVEQLRTSLKRARRQNVTINNPDEWEWQNALTLLTAKYNFKYYIAAVEYAPTTGHKHVHAYIRFCYCIYIQQLMKEPPGAYIEIANGTEIQNYDYVTKICGPQFTSGTPIGNDNYVIRYQDHERRINK